MPSTTTRAALPFPLSSDPVNVPSDMENLAARIDAVYGPESHGTFADIPAFGNFGFKYFATDITGQDGGLGQWFFDTGVRWCAINPPLPTFALANGSTPITGNQTFNENIIVDGNATVEGTLNTGAQATFPTLGVTGNATVDGTLAVVGKITSAGNQIPTLPIAGTPLVGTFTGQQVEIMMGVATVSFSSGVGTLTFPAAFPHGVFSFVFNVVAGSNVTFSIGPSGVTTSSAEMEGITSTGGLYNGSGSFSYLAMGF
jgi:hypothetical protein